MNLFWTVREANHLYLFYKGQLVYKKYVVKDKDAFDIARLLAKREGILAGGSSGANVWGALEIAKRLTSPAVIVTVIPDGGVKYLSKQFDAEWMKANHLL